MNTILLNVIFLTLCSISMETHISVSSLIQDESRNLKNSCIKLDLNCKSRYQNRVQNCCGNSECVISNNGDGYCKPKNTDKKEETAPNCKKIDMLCQSKYTGYLGPCCTGTCQVSSNKNGYCKP